MGKPSFVTTKTREIYKMPIKHHKSLYWTDQSNIAVKASTGGEISVHCLFHTSLVSLSLVFMYHTDKLLYQNVNGGC